MSGSPLVTGPAESPSRPFDARAARRWARRTVFLLERDRAAIDALNVFPVADGDTGTNLYFTMRSACAAADRVPAGSHLPAVVSAIANGALRGARGNSGLILSVALRGIADVLEHINVARPRDVARALAVAGSRARRAVGDPHEGTMLTVLRDVARAAQSESGDDVGELLLACFRAASAAVSRTTGQLDVLAAANVVDAGGIGILYLMEAMCEATTDFVSAGQPWLLHTPPATADTAAPAGGDPGAQGAAQGQATAQGFQEAAHCAPGAPQGFEVVAELRVATLPAGILDGLRGLDADSLVDTAGGFGRMIHLHLPGPDAVRASIELLSGAGGLSRLHIEALVPGSAHGPGHPGTSHGGRTPTALVVFARGTGLMTEFAFAGAEVFAGDSDLEQVFDAVTGRDVIVLPNDLELLAAARAHKAARPADDPGAEIAVVPCRAHVQGLAAAAVFEPGAPFHQMVAAMTAAAAGTRHGAVLVASEAGRHRSISWRKGEALGRINGSIRLQESDPFALSWRLIDRLLGAGGELVTLVAGRDCPAGLLARLRERLEEEFPEIEVTAIDGQQYDSVLLVGVE